MANSEEFVALWNKLHDDLDIAIAANDLPEINHIAHRLAIMETPGLADIVRKTSTLK